MPWKPDSPMRSSRAPQGTADDLIAHFEDLGRVVHPAPAHVALMQQPDDAADVEKRAVIGHVRDRTRSDFVFGQSGQCLGPLVFALFLGGTPFLGWSRVKKDIAPIFGATVAGALEESGKSVLAIDADADLAYQYSCDTYTYYWTQHGRDSYDDAGATLKSTVHFCPSTEECPYVNAFWNGTRMVYGDGFASADDVVAHATAKRERKACDWIVANDVSPATGIMGGSENAVALISDQGAESWPRMGKDAVAAKLAERAVADAGHRRQQDRRV